MLKSHPVFVRDSSQFWYKPSISREEAITLLKDKPPGTFVVRDSNSFPGKSDNSIWSNYKMAALHWGLGVGEGGMYETTEVTESRGSRTCSIALFYLNKKTS